MFNAIEEVQRCATKILPGFEILPYEERLSPLYIMCSIDDIIKTFKILNLWILRILFDPKSTTFYRYKY